MQNRFTTFKRGKVFYCEDLATGRQTSLKTRDEEEAQRLIQARNDAVKLPQMNLVMCKAIWRDAPHVAQDFGISREHGQL